MLENFARFTMFFWINWAAERENQLVIQMNVLISFVFL